MRQYLKRTMAIAAASLVLTGIPALAQDSQTGRIGDVSEFSPISDFCGDKPVRVALVDGFGGNSWRRITRFEFEDEASKCDNISEIIYVDGQNNPQKTISDLQGLVAQGIEAIVIFPDAGPAMLPAIRAAHREGTSIVAYTASPGGEPGRDYVDFIAPNTPNDGKEWAKWIAKQLDGKGNVVFLGGTPGNLQSQAEFEGAQEVFADHPEIKILGGRPIDTNWDPAETQRVVSGLLTQYDTIDGIISDYGGGSVGGIRAFLAADRPLVPWAANDANEFACLWEQNKGDNPDYQIMTLSSRPWLVRLALRKALAHAQGIDNDEPSIVNMPIVEDSTNPDMMPKCDPNLPPDAIQSSMLSVEQLKAVFE
ncbi:MAG: substrate-binding domain-containing protein [Roseovarius sp.]|nr:substrate-binding domain-containing protein [Roseovarius sp.]